MKARMSKALTVILERDDGEFWGRIEAPDFLHVTQGATVAIVTKNLRDLVADSLEHELKDKPEWQGVTADTIQFDYVYDLQSFFERFKELKMTAIAERAGLNKNLLHQYVAGHKHPSEQQAKKIENAVHALAEELRKVILA
ncbi:hypothetical protein [Larkinella soli]|uniref:hypothetical protein n=1 Tax=Larkinella soli TaxID=1770527 RepID=UPI000FFBC327|nr:hypothetical protein [Larkinella soli]